VRPLDFHLCPFCSCRRAAVQLKFVLPLMRIVLLTIFRMLFSLLNQKMLECMKEIDPLSGVSLWTRFRSSGRKVMTSRKYYYYFMYICLTVKV
jgi:hypothetical protein